MDRGSWTFRWVSNCLISTDVAEDTKGFWQLRCGAYEITNFGRKRSFFVLLEAVKHYEYGPF